MYRKDTAKSLHISLTPGLHKLDSLTGGGGLCISLNMPELGIEDVKSFFKHDTLFIQGKTITGGRTGCATLQAYAYQSSTPGTIV
ncbi:hypothetical protein Hanom_Chr14g01321541 [Helianthus anomalus]